MPAGIQYSRKVVKKVKRAKIDSKGKVRFGVIVGPKDCDPILPGTHDKAYPEELKQKNNFGPNASGWGGQYQIDTNLGLKIQRKYPDVFVCDVIPGSQITPARLAANHININLGYDMVNAFMSEDKKHEALVKTAFTSKASRLWPEWPLQNWIYCKEQYLQACQKGGVKIADTIFVNNGIRPAELLKKVQAKKWKRFFIKPAHLCSFGNAGGRFVTKECLADPSILTKYQKDVAKGHSHFLVQPYILKPNGKVFDEVRNWFIDGKRSYCIYTDGTDDDDVHGLVPGGKRSHLIEATRRTAEAAYKEVLKVAKWRGKSIKPPMLRIDVGVVPVQGAPSKVKTFINEIETEAATWLVRYVPFDVQKRMVSEYPKKFLEFIDGLDSSEKKPDAEAMEKLRNLVQKLKAGEPAVESKMKRKRGASSNPAKRARKA